MRHAVSPAEVEAAWAGIDPDTKLLVLTPEAHAALEELLAKRDGLVWAVVPS